MSRVAAAFAACLAAAFAGCGGGEPRDVVAADPTEAVRAAAANARAEGTLSFDVQYTRKRADRQRAERYGTAEGELDLVGNRGRMTVDLSGLLAGTAAEDAESPLSNRIELRWDASSVWGGFQGRWQRIARSRARESGGLIGRMPDEPAAIVELLAAARSVRRLGDADVDGEETTRYGFVVDATRAGGAGVPAELAPAFERRMYGAELPMEASLDHAGLPRRIVYRIEFPPLRARGRVILPPRTVEATYDLGRFGEDVDVGRPGG